LGGGEEMKTVLAALDASLAGNPVLVTARGLAEMLGAQVRAVHVAVDGDRTARNVAEAAGVELSVVNGPVVDRLIEAGRGDEVTAVAIGARGTPSGHRPLGSTAFAVATSVLKPVVVVPPDARVAPEFRRILVPLEGTTSTSLAPRSLVELARGANLDVIALHVHDEEDIPAFTDQPQHEHEAWAREFLARYCPWGIGAVSLERRVGRSEELIPLVAEQARCDLIALGWAQALEAGRAPVIRSTLERSRVPVILVPVHVRSNVQKGVPAWRKRVLRKR
jgi:nucleotide-binding universal stress UspA family protein